MKESCSVEKNIDGFPNSVH